MVGGDREVLPGETQEASALQGWPEKVQAQVHLSIQEALAGSFLCHPATVLPGEDRSHRPAAGL